MTTIYLSYSHADKEIAVELSAGLKALGYKVLMDSDTMVFGQDWRKSLLNALKNSDGVIVLVTENSLNSNYVISEIGTARAFIDEAENKKFLIPVLYGNIGIPSIVQDLLCVKMDKSSSGFAAALADIHSGISKFIGQKEAARENAVHVREKIEDKATDYIEAATATLKKRESENKIIAIVWYIIGFLVLVVGVLISFFGLKSFLELESHSGWVYLITILKSAVVIGLLVASSKYSFDLGRSFMHEALKNADRIHAISFGKFYLQAFGDKISSPKEVIEVFQNWNIDNTNSSFLKLDANNYDPKFTDKLVEIVKTLSDKVKPEK